MEFINLGKCDFDTVFKAFERAFSDYEIKFEKEEVRSMLKRRGYNPRLSFAAVDNGAIVAFTLNGIGCHNGIPTAYDTGTGTVKEYRGQGIAGQTFNHALPYLREAGIRQYLLEVLQNNLRAISVYQKMDFAVSREFICYRQTLPLISLRPSDCENANCNIGQVSPEFIRRAQNFCDCLPSWQNSIDSICRGAADLTCLGATIDGKPAGICVFDANTGDLTQIAVAKEFRRRGIASELLAEAVGTFHTDFIKVLNISPDNRSLQEFLEHRNIVPASRQFEMIKIL